MEIPFVLLVVFLKGQTPILWIFRRKISMFFSRRKINWKWEPSYNQNISVSFTVEVDWGLHLLSSFWQLYPLQALWGPAAHQSPSRNLRVTHCGTESQCCSGQHCTIQGPHPANQARYCNRYPSTYCSPMLGRMIPKIIPKQPSAEHGFKPPEPIRRRNLEC